ncbi:DUF1672 family protein, partial [Staphylococcus aureus]|uniref:DUF1672 family protein n=1 Tax=Staphylococcus aureus TaxID=1280 RepID=UPI00045028C3
TKIYTVWYLFFFFYFFCHFYYIFTTTLFSKKKNYTKKSNSENVIKMAEEIKKEKEIPNGIDLSIKFSDNKINTVKPNYNGKSTSEYGVFDQE